jgi:hypothetical protein
VPEAGHLRVSGFLLTRGACQRSHPVDFEKVRLPNFFDLSCFDAVAVPNRSTLRKVRLPNFFVSTHDVLAFWGLDF